MSHLLNVDSIHDPFWTIIEAECWLNCLIVSNTNECLMQKIIQAFIIKFKIFDELKDCKEKYVPCANITTEPELRQDIS